MMIRQTFCCALLLAFTTLAWAADKPPVKNTAKPATAAAKTHAKPVVKASSKPVAKAASKTSPTKPTKTVTKAPSKLPLSAASRPAPATLLKASFKTTPSPPNPALRGPTQTLTCRDGTEDRHARIGVVLVGGKTDSFAYYSKWKPRTCSIYLQRNRDGYSRWIDKGNTTSINLERGLFVIEHNKGEYRFVFQDIDRERYCGMEGAINGTLTIRKGSERCELAGIMEEGVPLGQAYAQREQAPQAAAAPEPAPRTRVAQRFTIKAESVWPSAGGSVSD